MDAYYFIDEDGEIPQRIEEHDRHVVAQFNLIPAIPGVVNLGGVRLGQVLDASNRNFDN